MNGCRFLGIQLAHKFSSSYLTARKLSHQVSTVRPKGKSHVEALRELFKHELKEADVIPPSERSFILSDKKDWPENVKKALYLDQERKKQGPSYKNLQEEENVENLDTALYSNPWGNFTL